MPRFRLSAPARSDLASIFATSLDRWGIDGQSRYAALLADAMRTLAADPAGPATRDRAILRPGVRSFHLRHARRRRGVGSPVHVIYYRIVEPDVIEIVRVLHERMEPSRHVDSPDRRGPPRNKRLPEP